MIEIKLAVNKLDIKIISELASKIWTEHYTPIIGIEQVDYMLNKFQSELAIENQIKEGFQYYLVFIDKIPAGYLSFIKKENTLFLSKIYILSIERGKGIGKFMMEFLDQKAADLNLKSISLTVNKNNTKSIDAYKKMGFVKVESIITDIGSGFVMDDFVMNKEI
ncbi:MAG: GNAT family N-acetyltransferase [Flavobacteriaceae bacterium]